MMPVLSLVFALSVSATAALPRAALRPSLAPATGTPIMLSAPSVPGGAPVGLGLPAGAPSLAVPADLPGDGGRRAVSPETLDAITRLIIDENDAGLHPLIFNAAFAHGESAYKELLAQRSDRRGFGLVLNDLYKALHSAHQARLPADVRIGASGLLHDSLGGFLDRVAADEAVPAETRDMARDARNGYLKEHRLLSALAWGRQEQDRIAEARRVLIAENVRQEEEGRSIGTNKLKKGWSPPKPDARPPEKIARGVSRWSEGLRDIAREFQKKLALFQLAQNRRDAAGKARLSPASAARETSRWERAARSFAVFLDSHESEVAYFLDGTLRWGFNRLNLRGKPLRIPTNPNLVLHETAEGYRLEAVFETAIGEQAVIDAFRRSIESYWTRRFKEKGRQRLFETKISVRILRDGEKPAADALLILDGMTRSYANERSISLRRDFDFSIPAHEFGHILGLPDEYVNDYDPDLMKIDDAQDRASVMASTGGLVLPRHLARAVALLRQGGRLITAP